MMAQDEIFSVKNSAGLTSSENANITDVSNTVISGKGRISFTVPEGKQPMDLEFTCYKLNGNNKVVHAKVQGKYKAGKHTIDLDLPADYDKNNLEITCQRKGSANVVTWGRLSGSTWESGVKGSVSDKLEIKNGSDNDNESNNEDADIKDISNTIVSGKGRISFTVPEGKQPMDLEFICYKLNGNNKVVHTKVQGKYKAGMHTIDLDLPADYDKNNLEITCQRKGSANVVTWSRVVGNNWKSGVIGNLKLPNAAVSDTSVITDVSNTVVSGVAKITFTVTKAKSPVQLEFISYKLNEDGKIIHARIKGQYSIGKHAIDLAVPANTDKYDLNIISKYSDKLSNIIWSRNAEDLWTETKAEANGKAAVTLPKLIISSTQVDKEGNNCIWKVKNPSAQDVTFFWNLEGTGQIGSNNIGAGEEIILTVNTGAPQKLITSVPGEQGYDVIVLASEFVPASASPTPSPSTSGATSDSVAGGTTGTNSAIPTPAPSTGTTTGTVAVGGTSTSNPTPTPSARPFPSPVAGGQTATDQPLGFGSTTVLVSDANQNNPSGISQLPQTGEQTPYSAYAIGGLLVLLGAFFLRRKIRS
jgi:LPXTG-motif cell wall-anchored protein